MTAFGDMKFLAKWRGRKPAEDENTAYVSERFGVRTLLYYLYGLS